MFGFGFLIKGKRIGSTHFVLAQQALFDGLLKVFVPLADNIDGGAIEWRCNPSVAHLTRHGLLVKNQPYRWRKP